jgi:hypothetical protein
MRILKASKAATVLDATASTEVRVAQPSTGTSKQRSSPQTINETTRDSKEEVVKKNLAIYIGVLSLLAALAMPLGRDKGE